MPIKFPRRSMNCPSLKRIGWEIMKKIVKPNSNWPDRQTIEVQGYKDLNEVIGVSAFPDTYVSPEIEELIHSKRPEQTEFVSGRFIPLNETDSSLVLIFELRCNSAIRKPIKLPVTIKQFAGDRIWFKLS